MELRWTEEAAADLERIADYLFERTPERAKQLVRTLYDAPASLLEFPKRGRLGKKEGTRELVISPLPYVVVSTQFGATRSTSSASCTARSSGRDGASVLRCGLHNHNFSGHEIAMPGLPGDSWSRLGADASWLNAAA